MARREDTNSKVELEIQNAGSNTYGAPRVMSITIRDSASGELIVEIPMTADQFMASLGGTYHGRIPAWVIPSERRARLGLKSVHETIKINVDSPINDMLERLRRIVDPKGLVSHLWSTDIDENSELRAWVNAELAKGDWIEWHIGRHNYGWALHVVKYVDPSEVETPDWDKD